MAITAFAAPAEKSDVCHVNGTGDYVVININDNAWESHEAHGDSKIGDTVDENCEPLTTATCPENAAEARAKAVPDVNWSVCNLSGFDISDRTLTGANLTNANLTGTFLWGSYLTNADLTNADLTNAFLWEASMTGANLTGVVWSNTTCPDGSNSNANDGDGFTCENNLTP